MGVYLPKVEMPKGDETITIQICPDGSIWQRFRGTVPEVKAVPVPPHGRLGDLDELWVEINTICDRRDAGIISDLTCLQQLLSAIRHVPTIVQAEP